MKKFKIVLYLLLIIALSILVWGNWDFFSARHVLQFNLVKVVYNIPAIPNGLYLLGCFLIGFLAASFRGLMKRFQDKKTNDMLKEKVTTQLDKIASLKKEVEFLQRNNNRTAQQTQQTAQTEETVTQN